MSEWLVSKLGYAPWFRRVFSTLPPGSVDANIEVEREYIARASRKVYGPKGLEAYEAEEASELRRAARRSLAQYFCHRALFGNGAVNAFRRALFALAFPWLLLLFLALSCRRLRPASGRSPDLVVFFWYERLYKFADPVSLGGQSYVLHTGKGVHFGGGELSFFLRALRACPRLMGYPGLLCNLVRWLGYYGYAVRHYRPRSAVVHFFENTASSSLMTAYLHEKGLRHIDIQHGEMLSPAMPGFCHFDEMRLWGEYFRQLLRLSHPSTENLKVCGTRYHRELFRGIRPGRQPRPKRLLIIDPFLYQDTSSFSSLMRRVLLQLDRSWQVRVRRHPAELRTTLGWMEHLNLDRSLKDRGMELHEEAPTLPIDEALGRSRLVMGVASTALIEAWIAGCKVIHLSGGPCYSALMDRYRGSPNVLFVDDDTDGKRLESFLTLPVVLDSAERERVDYLVQLEEEPAFAPLCALGGQPSQAMPS
jgi:hypothetical protein